jgi:hypothetical protein
VGTAVLELGTLAGVHLLGTVSAHDVGTVERLGAVAIDVHAGTRPQELAWLG